MSSRKERARKASERAMLEAAKDILWESPVGDIFSDLKPVEIARRAEPSRTTGAFYNVWPTQADFRRAFVRYLLSSEHFHSEREAQQLIEDQLDSPPVDLSELVRLAGNKYFDSLTGEQPNLQIQMALWTKAHTNQQIREEIKQLYDDITDVMIPLYERMIAQAGRRMRSPYTVRDFAVTISALVEGLHIRWMIDNDVVSDDLGPPPGVAQEPGRSWGTFASIAHILLQGMTEPDGLDELPNGGGLA